MAQQNKIVSKHAESLMDVLFISGKSQRLPGLVNDFESYEAELNITAADCVAFAEGVVRYFRSVGLVDFFASGQYDRFPEVDLNFCNSKNGDVLVHAFLISFLTDPVPNTTKALLAEKTRNANRIFKLLDEHAQPILLRELGVVAFPKMFPNEFHGYQQIDLLCQYFVRNNDKWISLNECWALENMLKKRDEVGAARTRL